MPRSTSGAIGVLTLAMSLTLALSGCGGSGGVGPPRYPQQVVFPLPSGHGLRVGDLVVGPGASEEHGNVVLTCPAGGSACVVTVSADGMAFYDRTGGIPTFMFSRPTYERDNPTAEDLLDYWNQPDALRWALGLSAVAAADIAGRRSTLADLINAAGGDSPEIGTLLRNVAPEDIKSLASATGSPTDVGRAVRLGPSTSSSTGGLPRPLMRRGARRWSAPGKAGPGESLTTSA